MGPTTGSSVASDAKGPRSRSTRAGRRFRWRFLSPSRIFGVNVSAAMQRPLIEGLDQSDEKPEIFFGVASAVGTPLDFAAAKIKELVATRSYDLEEVRMSRLPDAFAGLKTPPPPSSASAYERISAQMSRGNEVREQAGDGSVLAGLGVANTSGAATTKDPRALLFRQLKHPDEVYLLRAIYGEGFSVIGCHCPTKTRKANLEGQGMTAEEAAKLIERDEFEGLALGQRVRDTFHLSDFFLRVTGANAEASLVRDELSRFFELLFGEAIRTPRLDEYGMFLAYASGLRSAQLSRQVGAAILSPGGEVLGLGCNEVPKAGGGQYWEEDENDARDHVRGIDSNDEMKAQIVSDVIAAIAPHAREDRRQSLAITISEALKPTRIMHLTEFGRAVHAELDAILSASRLGTSVRGATLYTTTFPCHNCTKHIVAAGINRVVYIEPYPKSLAVALHDDSIEVDPPELEPVLTEGRRVCFQPFIGVAPRRYPDVFSVVSADGKAGRRKDAAGRVTPNVGLRVRASRLNYLERESAIAKAATLHYPGKGNETTNNASDLDPQRAD